MNGFDSDDAYRHFAYTVKNHRRWIFDGRVASFLDSVRKTSHSRECVIKEGCQLWRCQSGSTLQKDTQEVERECPKLPEEMVPKSEFVKSGGRANPPGFAYLYLANRPETAMAEMRPWVGESLSLANFALEKDARLVLCQQDSEDRLKRIRLNGERIPQEKVDSYVWGDISEAFSRPVNSNNAESDYTPTQILAEAFKAEGFDGVAYKSRLAQGLNVVLFDVEIAKPRDYFLYALRGVSYTFASDDPQFTVSIPKNGTPEYIWTLNSKSP